MASQQVYALNTGDVTVTGKVIAERMDVSTHGKVIVIGFIDGSSQTKAFNESSTYTWATQNFSSFTAISSATIFQLTVTSSFTVSGATICVAGNCYVFQSSQPLSGDTVLHLNTDTGRTYWGGDNAGAGGGGGG